MLVALGGTGIAYAASGDSEEQVTGPDAQKAKRAAIAAVGGGTVTEVEREDDGSAGGFEVEVKRDDGSQVEVHLDGDYKVVGQQAEDRKSTRLNSSHANISYAVFCLKKKKTNTST